MTLRIRQVVLAARDLDASVDLVTGVLGLSVAYRDPLVAEFGLRNVLMPIGDQFLEIVSPTRDNTAAGRLLERRGDSGYMLILQTDNFDRERARLDTLGVRIVWQASHPDIRAAHIHPKDIGGAIVSLDQAIPPDSWRWAGPDWRNHVSRTGARGVIGVEIETPSPSATAHRWAEVLGRDAPRNYGNAWRIPLEGDGAIEFIESGTRGEGVSAFTLAVDDATQLLARAKARGLDVRKDAVVLCGTRFNLSQAA